MALPSLERKQYKLGKYDIVAQPLLGSAHMLRYTVMLNGKRIGALMSVTVVAFQALGVGTVMPANM